MLSLSTWDLRGNMLLLGLLSCLHWGWRGWNTLHLLCHFQLVFSLLLHFYLSFSYNSSFFCLILQFLSCYTTFSLLYSRYFLFSLFCFVHVYLLFSWYLVFFLFIFTPYFLLQLVMINLPLIQFILLYFYSSLLFKFSLGTSSNFEIPDESPMISSYCLNL